MGLQCLSALGVWGINDSQFEVSLRDTGLQCLSALGVWGIQGRSLWSPRPRCLQCLSALGVWAIQEWEEVTRLLGASSSMPFGFGCLGDERERALSVAHLWSSIPFGVGGWGDSPVWIVRERRWEYVFNAFRLWVFGGYTTEIGTYDLMEAVFNAFRLWVFGGCFRLLKRLRGQKRLQCLSALGVWGIRRHRRT